MDILEKLAIEIPCSACGGRYEVTLKQVLLSQEMMHEGCPVQVVDECPPLAYSGLMDREIIQELQTVWARLEEKAHGAGGEVVRRVNGTSDTMKQSQVAEAAKDEFAAVTRQA